MDSKKLKLPNIFLLIASCGSGKTHFLRYLLYKFNKHNSFDNHLVISNTSKYTGEYSFIPSKYIHSEYQDQLIENLMNIQKRNPKFRTALILDDCLGSVNFNSNTIIRLFTQYRHLNITIFLTTQYICKISTTIRECCNYIFIFKQTIKRSINNIFENYGYLIQKANCFLGNNRFLGNQSQMKFNDVNIFTNFLEQNTNKFSCLFLDIRHKQCMRVKAPNKIPDFKT